MKSSLWYVHRSRLILCTLAALVMPACNRYEYVPDYMTPECRNAPLPPRAGRQIRSVIAESLSSGVVVGQVGVTSRPELVDHAVVVISRGSWLADTTDSLGRFRFANLAPGRYEVVVRRIGLQTTRDSVILPERFGVSLQVMLEPQVFDGPCSGYAVVPVKKPWWKLW